MTEIVVTIFFVTQNIVTTKIVTELVQVDVAALNLLEQQTLMRLEKCDTYAQTLLELRIKIVGTEVEELQKLL